MSDHHTPQWEIAPSHARVLASGGWLVRGVRAEDERHARLEAGLPMLEILKMATSCAADILGLGDKIGTIGPGQVDGLVLVHGNPLVDLEALGSVAMMKEGRVVYGRAFAASASTLREDAIGGTL